MPRVSLLVLAAIGLAGCAPAPPAYLAAPAAATHAVRPVTSAPVTAGAGRFEIVEPKGWDELNRAVTPKGGSHAP
jgi:hypothetical protein